MATTGGVMLLVLARFVMTYSLNSSHVSKALATPIESVFHTKMAQNACASQYARPSAKMKF